MLRMTGRRTLAQGLVCMRWQHAYVRTCSRKKSAMVSVTLRTVEQAMVENEGAPRDCARRMRGARSCEAPNSRMFQRSVARSMRALHSGYPVQPMPVLSLIEPTTTRREVSEQHVCPMHEGV
jgi:hypothetical protein